MNAVSENINATGEAITVPEVTNASGEPAGITVYSALAGALAVAKTLTGVKVIQCKRKKSVTCPEGFERAVILPLSYFDLSEEVISDSLRSYFENHLLELAGRYLLSIGEREPLRNSIPASNFSRESLTRWATEDNSESIWINKEDLEREFKLSATWERMTGREEFKTSKQYQALVNQFLEQFLKFSAKNCNLTEAQIDRVLSRIDPADLNSDWGAFIAIRADHLKKKLKEKLPELDFDSL